MDFSVKTPWVRKGQPGEEREEFDGQKEYHVCRT